MPDSPITLGVGQQPQFLPHGDSAAVSPPRAAATPEVFISYAWGDESKAGRLRDRAVHSVVDVLRSRFRVSIDKDMRYGSSISEFMKRIGNGRYVVVIVSDKYLRSRFCMTEMLFLSRHEDFRERIFPVLLEDAGVSVGQKLRDYREYWESIWRDGMEELKDSPYPADRQAALHALNDINAIIGLMTQLLALLRDTKLIKVKLGSKAEVSKLIGWIQGMVEEKESPQYRPQASGSGASGGEDLAIVHATRKLREKLIASTREGELVLLGIEVMDLQKLHPENVEIGRLARQCSEALENCMKRRDKPPTERGTLRFHASVEAVRYEAVLDPAIEEYDEDPEQGCQIGLEARTDELIHSDFPENGLEEFDRVFEHGKERYGNGLVMASARRNAVAMALGAIAAISGACVLILGEMIK